MAKDKDKARAGGSCCRIGKPDLDTMRSVRRACGGSPSCVQTSTGLAALGTEGYDAAQRARRGPVGTTLAACLESPWESLPNFAVAPRNRTRALSRSRRHKSQDEPIPALLTAQVLCPHPDASPAGMASVAKPPEDLFELVKHAVAAHHHDREADKQEHPSTPPLAQPPVVR